MKIRWDKIGSSIVGGTTEPAQVANFSCCVGSEIIFLLPEVFVLLSQIFLNKPLESNQKYLDSHEKVL